MSAKAFSVRRASSHAISFTTGTNERSFGQLDHFVSADVYHMTTHPLP